MQITVEEVYTKEFCMAEYANEPLSSDINPPAEGQPDGQPTEINPGQVGTNTEVDLDTQKIENYPNREPGRK